MEQLRGLPEEQLVAILEKALLAAYRRKIEEWTQEFGKWSLHFLGRLAVISIGLGILWLWAHSDPHIVLEFLKEMQ